jgi:integrase/recombinase XerD
MTDEAMSPLRRRMIEDMTIRKFAPKTQHDYVQRIKNFAAFLGRSPDTASFEDVRRYQLHLTTSGIGVPTLNQTISTLRFFFRVTLKRHDIVEHTHFIREPRKLPVVLSPEEVARMLDAAPGLKYKAALSVAYGAGLRATLYCPATTGRCSIAFRPGRLRHLISVSSTASCNRGQRRNKALSAQAPSMRAS